jgi:hypothetical protein
MLVGRGSFAGVPILAPAAVRSLLGPLDSVGLALSWGRERVDGRLVLEHSGNARTMSARMRLLPEARLAIVVLASTNSGPFFDGTDALLDGVNSILDGDGAPRLWPEERLFKAAVLLGSALAIAGAARRARAWNRAGMPIGLDGSAGTAGRLSLDLGLAALVVLGVPRLVGVPLSTMTEYFPDLAFALIASAGAGVIGDVLGAFTRSAERGS